MYDLGKDNRADGVSCQMVVRERLDRLGIGQEIEVVQWAEGRIVKLPP